MRDILDPRFAAQKLAASTLEALRMQALIDFQLTPEGNSQVDKQIVDRWNRVQTVIETNMAEAFRRRDKMMISVPRSRQDDSPVE